MLLFGIEDDELEQIIFYHIESYYKSTPEIKQIIHHNSDLKCMNSISISISILKIESLFIFKIFKSLSMQGGELKMAKHCSLLSWQLTPFLLLNHYF